MARPSSVEDYVRKVRVARDGVSTRPCPTEHEEQVALFDWAKIHERKWPVLKRYHAIANAGAGAQRGQAGKMKAEGVKPHVPDTFLPISERGYHGLYLELKALDGVLDPGQREWLLVAATRGYAAEVCFGFEEARDVIVAYLSATYVPRPLRTRR